MRDCIDRANQREKLLLSRGTPFKGPREMVYQEIRGAAAFGFRTLPGRHSWTGTMLPIDSAPLRRLGARLKTEEPVHAEVPAHVTATPR